MAEPSYDLVILGGGPGGYVAAVRAAQLGLSVACVEREARLGGVCLREGCIPTKALLDSSEYVHLARGRFAEHGIGVGEVTVDLPAMMARKDRVVEALTDGVAKLLARHKVEVVHGIGRLAGPDRVAVTPADGGPEREITGGAVLLATGSRSAEIPSLPLDGERVVDSTGVLALDRIPEHLVVVGGGAIGLELGSVWRRLGARVTVVEALPRIAANLDGQIGRALARLLKKQGLDLKVGTLVTGADICGEQIRLTLHTEGREDEHLDCDQVLVAVGRKPLTDGLGLEEAGVLLDKAGRVVVDSEYRTAVPSVFAIGDLIAGPMLAHKASAEGTAVAETLAGLPGEVNYDAMPSVIYTNPEVAAVGATEEQLKERGVPYVAVSFPFGGVGRAVCLGEAEGMVKLLAHRDTDRLLGAHIVGPRASDLIAECVLAVEFAASAEDLARTVHGHPTFGEGVMEAAAALTRGRN
ncbi:MAG TPA: dihydrolipoyl dehydrogenase [Deferrisomatales bacterium]|nr:dihydrolipoyl dehydrogenase [Deferrisomatales bacterium]